VAHPAIKNVGVLALISILVYAVYNLTNRIRHHGTVNGEIYDALCQGCREATKGGKLAEKIMANRWLNSPADLLPTKCLIPWPKATAKFRQVRRGGEEVPSSSREDKRRRVGQSTPIASSSNGTPPLPARVAAEVPRVILHTNPRRSFRRNRFAFGAVSPEQARAATAQGTPILGYDEDGFEVRRDLVF